MGLYRSKDGLHRCEQEGPSQPLALLHHHLVTFVRRTESGVQSQTLLGDSLPYPGGKQKWESYLHTICVKDLEPFHRAPFLLFHPPAPHVEIVSCPHPHPSFGELVPFHNNPEACLGKVHFGRHFVFKRHLSLANWRVYKTQDPVLFSSL